MVSLGDVCETFFVHQSVANISDDMAQQTFCSLQDELKPQIEIYPIEKAYGRKSFDP